MTSNFALTGKRYAPLPVEHTVRVILSKNPNAFNYEEIGVLQVKQSDMNNLAKAINLAKKEARIRGGDLVFFISSGSSMAVFGTQYGIFSSSEKSFVFVICKEKK
jgi:hypothetical protein